MRRALLGVGFAATGSGLALTLTPLSVPVALPTLPTLGVVALVAGAVGALAALGRSTAGPTTYDLPDPDGGEGVRVPGDGFDERLASVSARPDAADREAVRERLRRVAVTVLTETTGCTRETARQRLADGEWTDDPRARAFFTGAKPPLRERVRTVLTGEPTFARRARRVVEALGERTEGAR